MHAYMHARALLLRHLLSAAAPVHTAAPRRSSTFKKGRTLFVKIGDKDVEYNRGFRLFLHTKLSNPHFPPEVQAETTLINFTVTEAGLEDQLLALVVNKERPDLEETKTQLIIQGSEFTIKLKQLEDELLYKLSTAEGDITGAAARRPHAAWCMLQPCARAGAAAGMAALMSC